MISGNNGCNAASVMADESTESSVEGSGAVYPSGYNRKGPLTRALESMFMRVSRTSRAVGRWEGS
jgi:hypothetical protein